MSVEEYKIGLGQASMTLKDAIRLTRADMVKAVRRGDLLKAKEEADKLDSLESCLKTVQTNAKD